MSRSLRERAVGWGMLLRLPNLPAVPGDPLLGLLLAGAGGAIAVPTALTVMAAALSLYACGLLLNDVADIAEDRGERPERPLPSGRVSPRAAVVVALLLAALGLLLAWSASLACGVVAAVLLGAILCYTFWVRRWPAVALTVMGCCRGLSVLLGAAALGWPALSAPMVVVGTLTMTGYTIALAAVALGETEHKQIGLRRFGPCVMVMAGIVLARLMLSPESVLGAPWVALVWANVAMLRAANHGRRLAGAPPPALVGKTIGCFVRDMTLLQAAFCALATSSLPLSAAVGSLWLLSWVLSRRFYGS